MSGKPFNNLCVQMLAGADQIDHRRVPARFDEAQARMRDAIARLEAAGVPDLTLVAVMLSEMIPRMVRENGPEWAAAVLTNLASNIRAGAVQSRTRQ
jgi:hypothetical protein